LFGKCGDGGQIQDQFMLHCSMTKRGNPRDPDRVTCRETGVTERL